MKTQIALTIIMLCLATGSVLAQSSGSHTGLNSHFRRVYELAVSACVGRFIFVSGQKYD